MKLLIAAVTFAATLGMLFLIETGKSPKEDYAQIIESLKEGNKSTAASATPSLIKARAPTPASTSTPIPTPAPTPSPAPQNSPVARQTPVTPTSPPTQTPIKTPSPTPSETPTLTATSMPSSPPQEAGQGFIDILSITSPVEQNSTAQLSISTLPDAQCSIKVTLPSGNQSTAKGLEAKAADVSGNAAWSWKINWNTTPGTANIDVTCSKNEQNFSKSLQMTIIER